MLDESMPSLRARTGKLALGTWADSRSVALLIRRSRRRLHEACGRMSHVGTNKATGDQIGILAENLSFLTKCEHPKRHSTSQLGTLRLNTCTLVVCHDVRRKAAPFCPRLCSRLQTTPYGGPSPSLQCGDLLCNAIVTEFPNRSHPEPRQRRPTAVRRQCERLRRFVAMYNQLLDYSFVGGVLEANAEPRERTRYDSLPGSGNDESLDIVRR